MFKCKKSRDSFLYSDLKYMEDAYNVKKSVITARKKAILKISVVEVFFDLLSEYDTVVTEEVHSVCAADDIDSTRVIGFIVKELNEREYIRIIKGTPNAYVKGKRFNDWSVKMKNKKHDHHAGVLNDRP